MQHSTMTPAADPFTSTTLPADQLLDYVEHAPFALHWVNAHGIIEWANQAELDFLGYAAEEYIGQSISGFHTDPQKVDELLRRLQARETVRGFESTLRCKDGTVKTVAISSNVLWLNGQFVHTRCFTADITALKKIERAFRQSERRYREVMELLPAAVYTTDAHGLLTAYNSAAVQLWGRPPVIGKDLWCGSWQIRRPDGSPLALDECPMAVALRDQRPVFGEEIVVVRPDGTKRQVAPYPQPMRDESGKLIGAVNMLIDITERKAAEEVLLRRETELQVLAGSLETKVIERTADLQRKNDALQQSEQRYHKMVAEVRDYAILLLDPDGVIQNWNQGATHIKGYSEQEAIGKSFKIFYLPEDQQKGLPEQLLSQAVQQGRAVHEGWRVRKDGSRFWGSTVITALHDADNQLMGFSKVTRDLSERKVNEDMIRQYSAELELQNRELEQFAYVAAHDLKEPLRKIQFYNNYVVSKNAAQLDEKGAEYLRRSVEACGRMSQLIDDLLTYSRATADLRQFQPVDLQDLAEEIVFSHKDGSDGMRVHFQLGHLPVVQGIPFQLKQLLDNLINNAIKYRHPDREPSIQLVSARVKSDEHLPAVAPGWYHQVSITDNGIGFEQKHAGRIFDIFQRLHNKGEFSGSGIGLAICKKIVMNHDGFMRASGEPGKGARFDVFFPIRHP